MPDPDEVRVQDFFQAEVKARFAFGMAQNVGFAERWAQFWSNHFCVATGAAPSCARGWAL